MHADQVRAWHHLYPYQRKALRAGRRWGKTDYAKLVSCDTTIKGGTIGWFAPDYRILSEAFHEIVDMLGPARLHSSITGKIIRTKTGGRFDFWTLDNERAGRSRMYDGAIIDEGAFGPKGEAMMHIWDEAIEPTLLDKNGWALACSNTAGDDPENWFWRICNERIHGFVEFHAPTINNLTIPKLKPGETQQQWMLRRQAVFDNLKRNKHPLVFAQEYLAEFVDWSGVAFFNRDKLLINGQPHPDLTICDGVFAVVDSASKTGSDNDGTAVTYFAKGSLGSPYPLIVLDWDIVQIEGDLLMTWLPTVFQNLKALALNNHARMGSLGVFIEDANSGTILIQAATRAGMPVHKIESGLTAMGKDQRAMSVSDRVYQGKVKISRNTFDKTVMFKGAQRNHFLSQVLGFRFADKDAAKRADDLLDTFTYGIALSLGKAEAY